ncbi:conserved hypothetical protein [Culex quinquefasciatus]|uniref:Uncharacterized protein n=1 Tax=Culex quinquefasciatus TaxID=7176 RepID=B0WP34_CULQU|nr:conserved hypothetical protein [Culex quinquefasciatus]|eukprot:XP_001850468.1 conserved hypothetical protein [Culex quinquefasciatus]
MSPSGHREEALSYVLRAIEYLASVHAGAFSCVLFDVAPQRPFDNILEGILQAPRLEHVTKYVVNGTKAHPELDEIDLGSKLARKPLLLVLYIRKEFLSFANRGTTRNIFNFFCEFDPTTKVIPLLIMSECNYFTFWWITKVLKDLKSSPRMHDLFFWHHFAPYMRDWSKLDFLPTGNVDGWLYYDTTIAEKDHEKISLPKQTSTLTTCSQLG